MTDLDFLLNETPPHLHETIKRLTQVSPDSNVEKNREMLLQRSIVGLAKYGVTTDNNPLPLRAWLQRASCHAQKMVLLTELKLCLMTQLHFKLRRTTCSILVGNNELQSP